MSFLKSWQPEVLHSEGADSLKCYTEKTTHSSDQLGITIYWNRSLSRNHKGRKCVENINMVKVVNCKEKLFLCRAGLWKRAGKRGSGKWNTESGITFKVVLQISIKVLEDKVEEISQCLKSERKDTEYFRSGPRFKEKLLFQEISCFYLQNIN